jgi:hypothetical protein
LRLLLADTALTAVLRAVFAILTVLARIARIGSSAGRRKDVSWNLVDENHCQQDLGEGNEQS